MSSETLRRAAALMRERAQGATWVDFHGKSDWAGDVTALGLDDADFAHVSGMSPAVALAVADWLDQAAIHVEGGSLSSHPMSTRALAVARAYLGES